MFPPSIGPNDSFKPPVDPLNGDSVYDAAAKSAYGKLVAKYDNDGDGKITGTERVKLKDDLNLNKDTMITGGEATTALKGMGLNDAEINAVRSNLQATLNDPDAVKFPDRPAPAPQFRPKTHHAAAPKRV